MLLHSATLSLFHSSTLSFWLYYLLSSFPSIAATLFYLSLFSFVRRCFPLFADYFVCSPYISFVTSLGDSSSFFLLAFLLFHFFSLLFLFVSSLTVFFYRPSISFVTFLRSSSFLFYLFSSFILFILLCLLCICFFFLFFISFSILHITFRRLFPSTP